MPRLLRWVLASILLGAITSFGLMVLGGAAMSRGHLGSFRVLAIREPDGRVVIWSGNVSLLGEDLHRFTQFDPNDFGEPARSPWWVSQMEGLSMASARTSTRVLISGWPMRSMMEYSHVEMCSIGADTEHFVRWSKVVANLVIHSLAWSLLLPVLSAIHARYHSRPTLRTRRGLCPACAYDLRHELAAGCPECGWGRGESTGSPLMGRSPRRRA